MDRTKALAELAAARGSLNGMRRDYPELPLLVSQLKRRFAGDVFSILTAYLALEAREEKALGALREMAAWIDPPADVCMEDGA